jgi:thermitase
MSRRLLLTLAIVLAAATSGRPAASGADFAARLAALGIGSVPRAGGGQPPAAVPNQLIVRFAPGTGTPTRANAHAHARARVMRSIPQLGIQIVDVPDAAAALAYRAQAGVLWVEPNYTRRLLVMDPDDPGYNELDFLLPTDPADATWYKWDARLIHLVEGLAIWPNRYFTSSGKGAAGVRIGIVDTGIDEGHPDFINAGGSSTDVAAGGQLELSLNRTILGGEVSDGAHDEYGHGTHVAGIAAAATNNGTGTTGNGINATILSIRTTDATGVDAASDDAQAIVYAADHGALIVNLSLGDFTYSQAEQDAVNYAWSKGTLVIAAAGNDGGGANRPIYPAALSRVLAVSATSEQDLLTTYSNYGEYVGIAAPGGDIDFARLTILGVWSTLPTYPVTLNDPEVYGAQLNYDYLIGTSMSAPQVTGVAALYAGMKGFTQSTPNAPLRIWQALQRGAENIAGGSGNWEQLYGFGRLDVAQTMALDRVPNPRGATAGSITGQILYRGTPIANAGVTAAPVGGGTSLGGSSRADGGYRIARVPPGTYRVTAAAFGDSQSVTGVTVIAGADTPGVDISVGAGSPPAPPTGLSASPGDGQVELAWNPSSGAEGYNLKRGATSGGPYSTIAAGVAATHFTDTGRTNGTRYFYVVSAENSAGESANSGEASAVPVGGGGATVDPPTGLTARAGRRKITLRWTQSTTPGVSQNRVYRGTASGGPFSPLATLAAANSYVDTGPARRTKYYYVVTALDAASHESAYSNEVARRIR